LIFENLTENLSGIPSFESFHLTDKNPLSGTKKNRTCNKPNQAMDTLHQRLIIYLRSLKKTLPFATACRPKNSPRKNIQLHSKNRFVFATDIRNAYTNVNGIKLTLILCNLDPKLKEKQREVLNFLEKYCLSPEGGLVTGAPASPDLFNIYAAILLDESLGLLCQKYGITFSRYLDDLLFSSSKVRIGKRKRKEIRKIIESAGFEVNHRKSMVWDLKKGPVVINGIGLELGGRIFLPRHFLEKIRGLLHRAMVKKDVNPNTINGLMGVFFSITDRRKPNQIEQKIIKSYRSYRRFIKWGIMPE
jgi:hypothetical protein